MGKYTIYENSFVDENIESMISKITKKVVNKLSEFTIASIYLVGGFGRGEGSVLIENDKIIPLKDFDFIIVFHNALPNNELIIEIKKQVLLDVMNIRSNDVFQLHKFTFDINVISLSRVLSIYWSDIFSYEWKTASILLYGIDIRKNIKTCSIHQMPQSASFHFVFQKLIGLTGHLTFDKLIKKTWASDENLNLAMECYKTYIEIGTCISLIANCYAPSFYQRAENLKKEVKHNLILQRLFNEIPNLLDLIILSTKKKLKPNKNEFPKNLKEFYFQTKNHLIKVIDNIVFSKINLKLKINPIPLLNTDTRNYWDLFIYSNIYFRIPVFKNLYKSFPAIIFPLRIIFRIYLFKLQNYSQRISLLYLKTYPNLIIYSIGYLLLSCINSDGINEFYLNTAEKLLNSLYFKTNTTNLSLYKKWEVLRKKFIFIDSQYKGLR